MVIGNDLLTAKQILQTVGMGDGSALQKNNSSGMCNHFYNDRYHLFICPNQTIYGLVFLLNAINNTTIFNDKFVSFSIENNEIINDATQDVYSLSQSQFESSRKIYILRGNFKKITVNEIGYFKLFPIVSFSCKSAMNDKIDPGYTIDDIYMEISTGRYYLLPDLSTLEPMKIRKYDTIFKSLYIFLLEIESHCTTQTVSNILKYLEDYINKLNIGKQSKDDNKIPEKFANDLQELLDDESKNEFSEEYEKHHKSYQKLSNQFQKEKSVLNMIGLSVIYLWKVICDKYFNEAIYFLNKMSFTDFNIDDEKLKDLSITLRAKNPSDTTDVLFICRTNETLEEDPELNVFFNKDFKQIIHTDIFCVYYKKKDGTYYVKTDAKDIELTNLDVRMKKFLDQFYIVGETSSSFKIIDEEQLEIQKLRELSKKLISFEQNNISKKQQMIDLDFKDRGRFIEIDNLYFFVPDYSEFYINIIEDITCNKTFKALNDFLTNDSEELNRVYLEKIPPIYGSFDNIIEKINKATDEDQKIMIKFQTFFLIRDLIKKNIKSCNIIYTHYEISREILKVKNELSGLQKELQKYLS
jgi:hypothetical protein